MIRRTHVQTHNVMHFLHKERIVCNFEVTLPMQSHTKHLEPPMHHRFGDAPMLGHGADAPIRSLGRLAVQGGIAHFGHPLVIMGVGTTGALFLPQAFDSLLQIAPPPFADLILLIPSRLPMETWDSPSPQANTIPPRSTIPRGSDREQTMLRKWSFPWPSSLMGVVGRPPDMSLLLPWLTLFIIFPSSATGH